MSHETLLRAEDTVLVMVDVQEKLLPHIAEAERVVRNCRLLVEGAKLLGVPVLCTEQYPKGLGPTVPELRAALPPGDPIAKMSFSCAGEDAFLDALEEMDRDQVLLCGIETHVCVLQTALDLLDNGAQVQVAADAVGSRAEANRAFALERMRRAGVVVTVAESALFECLSMAGTETFKAVSRLVRG
jgi:nicotinamidase-related amidase